MGFLLEVLAVFAGLVGLLLLWFKPLATICWGVTLGLALVGHEIIGLPGTAAGLFLGGIFSGICLLIREALRPTEEEQAAKEKKRREAKQEAEIQAAYEKRIEEEAERRSSEAWTRRWEAVGKFVSRRKS